MNYNTCNCHKSWSAGVILEILENTRGRRKEQHYESSVGEIWCKWAKQLMLEAERYPALAQRLITCLLFTDRFYTLQSADDDVVKYVAQLCKYALHVHDDCNSQIEAMERDFKDKLYSNNNNNNNNNISDMNSKYQEYCEWWMTREMYSKVVAQLLRRPPPEVTFAAEITNIIAAESTLPTIIHHALTKVLEQPSHFKLNFLLHETSTVCNANAQSDKKEQEEEEYEEELQLEKEQLRILQMKEVLCKPEESEMLKCSTKQSKHFLVYVQHVLTAVVHGNHQTIKSRSTLTDKNIDQQFEDKAKNTLVSNSVTEKDEQCDKESECLLSDVSLMPSREPITLSLPTTTAKSVGNLSIATSNTHAKSLVQLQQVYRSNVFVHWLRERTETNSNEWHNFAKSLSLPVKLRNKHEVLQLRQKLNSNNIQEISTLTSVNTTKTNTTSDNRMNITETRVGIPEWVDHSDSDIDNDDNINFTSSLRNVTTTTAATTTNERESDVELKECRETNHFVANNNNSKRVHVTWVQDGELTLKDGKFIIVPTNTETKNCNHRQQQQEEQQQQQYQQQSKNNSNNEIDTLTIKSNHNTVNDLNRKWDKVEIEKNENNNMKVDRAETISIMEREIEVNTEEQGISKEDKEKTEKGKNNIDHTSNKDNNKNNNGEAATIRTTTVTTTRAKVSSRSKRPRTSRRRTVKEESIILSPPEKKMITRTTTTTTKKKTTKSNTSQRANRKAFGVASNNSHVNSSNTPNAEKWNGKAVKVVSTHNVPLLSRDVLWELLHNRWNISSALQNALSIGLESQTREGDGQNNNNNNNNNNNKSNIATKTDENVDDYTKNTSLTLPSIKQSMSKAESSINSVEIIPSHSTSSTDDESSHLESHSSFITSHSLSKSSSVEVVSSPSSTYSQSSFDFYDNEDDQLHMDDFIIT